MGIDLSKRCILVTGASSGIGEETARTCAQHGARVVIVSEREAELDAVAQSIRQAGGDVIPRVVDLSKPDQVEGLIERIEAEVGHVDTLVNNAGVGLHAPVLQTRTEDMRFLFEVNFFAVAELCKQALTAMATRRNGRIVNVSSAAGRFGSPTISAYSATKGAVHAYTQSLRIEARVHGVLVSEVLPISVRTRFFDNVKDGKYVPHGFVLTPEGVAQDILLCIASRRPRPEILPFRGIRLVFVLNALLPGLLVRIAGRSYANSLQQKLKHP